MLKDSTNHQSRTLAALTEISRFMSGSLDYRQIAYHCLQALGENLDLEHCGLVMPSKDQNKLVLSVGINWPVDGISEFDRQESALGKVFASGMPIAVHDISELENLVLPPLENPASIAGFLAVPVLVNRRPIGVLSAYRVSNRTMVDEDIKVMKIIASILSQTLQLADVVEEQSRKLKKENEELHAELENKFHVDNLMSSSQAMRVTLEMIKKVASTDASVLLRGESGTGKTMIAKGIHFSSSRRKNPLITVNCAAIPETLIESELFGHEKGSFTGAINRRIGKFESAAGGSLFLDEIGELSLETQAKLLRIIQEGSFERVGSNQTLHSDVRLICATNAQLEKMVREKKFREDLYYRLMVIPLFIPPLRDRREDILPLIHHFTKTYNAKYGKSVQMSREAMEFLENHSWPGNVRELENTIERTIILATSQILHSSDIPLLGGLTTQVEIQVPETVARLPQFEFNANNPRAPYERVPLRETQVKIALEESAGIQTLASKKLGVSLRQLRYAIKKYGLEAKTFKA